MFQTQKSTCSRVCALLKNDLCKAYYNLAAEIPIETVCEPVVNMCRQIAHGISRCEWFRSKFNI